MCKILVYAFILLGSKLSFACSCNIGNVEEKYKTHVSVFLGKVTEIYFYNSKNKMGDQRIKVKFDILNQWKGSKTQNQLFTVYNESSCWGYWFKEGEEYVIYAFEEDGKLNTWWCGGVISKKDVPEQFAKEFNALNEIGK